MESIISVRTGFFWSRIMRRGAWRQDRDATNKTGIFYRRVFGTVYPLKNLLSFLWWSPKKRLLIGKFRTQQNHDGTKVALFLISPYLAPKFYCFRRKFASKIVFFLIYSFFRPFSGVARSHFFHLHYIIAHRTCCR